MRKKRPSILIALNRPAVFDLWDAGVTMANGLSQWARCKEPRFTKREIAWMRRWSRKFEMAQWKLFEGTK